MVHSLVAVLWFAPSSYNDGAGASRADRRDTRPMELAPPLDETVVLQQIRAGDQAAFSTLVRAMVDVLQAYAYRYVHSADVAGDVVQDVFVRLWHARETLVVPHTLRQYLFVATRFRALELLRRDRIEQRHAGALEPPAGEPPVDEHVARIDRFTSVVEALRALPPRQREIIRLRWTEGLTNAAVGQRLGISVKGVEIQLTRAFATLRERLRGV
jgi:RNA polymerase sigma-70 factor (ECF subfamily)